MSEINKEAEAAAYYMAAVWDIYPKVVDTILQSYVKALPPDPEITRLTQLIADIRKEADSQIDEQHRILGTSSLAYDALAKALGCDQHDLGDFLAAIVDLQARNKNQEDLIQGLIGGEAVEFSRAKKFEGEVARLYKWIENAMQRLNESGTGEM